MTELENASRAGFDLVSEPWIMVRFVDGSVADVSLHDVFARAHEIRDVVGEVPTQTFAITRLLLAVLTRAIQFADAENQLTGADWQRLWEDGLPLGDIADYLDEFRNRFDLLHPERPFFQVAGLQTSKDEVKDVSPLIFDLPSNNRLFTTRAGEGIKRLSFAEAARWLINSHAFDSSGIKSGAVGDPRVKGGRGYPIGVAWSGLLGGLLVEGQTLSETLLLNLVGHAEGSDGWQEDVPPWERGPDSAAERPNPYPTGPVDLATWQSRRIRLVSDSAGIVGSLICNGDRLTPQNGYHNEMMTAWRYSDPQTKKAGLTTYMPREHQPSRALWRGIGALLPKREVITSGKDPARSLSPGVIGWISFLQEHGRLSAERYVALRAIGVEYGSNSSVVNEVVEDRVLVSLALLNEQNVQLAEEAERAVVLAEEGVRALRRLAENLALASGGEPEGPRDRAEEYAYAALDAPYRHWLAGLTAMTDPVVALDTWRTEARGILLRLAEELVRQSGPAAWRGRELTLRGSKPELVNTSRAENWFRRALHNTFDTSNGKEDAA